jgi:AbrB family looped-hinge helix DNA binding protein
MDSVTISPKFQVVIPRNVRDSMKLSPGQKVQVIQYNNRIELIPEKDITQMRGFLKGINTDFIREGDRL